MSKGCKYKEYNSNCGGQVFKDGYCKEHYGKRCWKCGKQATGYCTFEGSFLICGTPECDKHSHWSQYH